MESAAPAEDSFTSPDHKAVHNFAIPTSRGQKQRPPMSKKPLAMWKSQHHYSNSSKIARGGNIGVPHPPVWITSLRRIKKYSIRLQLQQTANEKGDAPGPYHPARGNPGSRCAIFCGMEFVKPVTHQYWDKHGSATVNPDLIGLSVN